MKILNIISLSLLSLSTWSTSLPDKNASVSISDSEHTSMDAPKEIQANFKKEDFKPYMLNHFNEGCPTNSTCTKAMGKKYKGWSETLSASASLTKTKDKLRVLDSFRKERE